MADAVRLDKWLWAARLYKTRTMAAHGVGLGRVSVNGQLAKASRELHLGDRISVQQGGHRMEVTVLLLSTERRGAPLARAMYAETAASQAARELAAQQRRLASEPAAAAEQGRPTKRDRRALAQWRRWSASADE